MGRFVRSVLWLAAKDLNIEWRTRDSVVIILVFGLLVVLIFSFAFEMEGAQATTLAPGVLWAAVAFSSTLGLSRSFTVERDRGSIEGLLLLPVDRSAIFLAKMLVNLLYMGIAQVVLLPALVVLLNVPIPDLGRLLLVVVLGSVGFAGVGTLFSAIAIHSRAREVMLPVLLLPVAAPLLLACVKMTAGVLAGTAFMGMQHWLGLLVAYDVIFLALSVLLFDYVVEA
jgi:heme exporter protein B